MEEIPKVNDNQVAQLEVNMRQMISQGTITGWLDDQLHKLADTNPILYKYIMGHAQKFAIGAIMIGDAQTIAISATLEYMLLLSLISSSFKSGKELKAFTDFWGKFFPKGKLG